METGPLLAILLTVFAHFAGIAALLVFAGGDIMDIFKSGSKRDDDWGEPYDEPPLAPVPPSDDVPLLPDASQSPVRLREPGRIAERYQRPARRPEHAPERDRPGVPQR